MFAALLTREFRLAWQNKGQWLTSLGFIFIVLALFPIALDAEVVLLQRIGSGVIWVALLLSVLLSVANQFREDWLDGSLEQIVLSSRGLFGGVLSYVWAKYLVSIAVLVVPLILALPLMLLQYHLGFELLAPLALNVLLGGVTIVGLALFGAALTISIARSGILMVLIVLPLCIPVLIFSSQLALLVQQGMEYRSLMLLLSAMSLVVLAIIPWLLAWLVRLQVNHS